MFVSPRVRLRCFPADFAGKRSNTFNMLRAAVDAGMEQALFAPADSLGATLDPWALAHGFVGLYAGEPAVVKVFLLYSEEYKKRSNDSSYQYHCGMNPALVPEIVRRAHAAGLKVSAHIYTATDFRNAVNGGVDLVAHFPGTGYDEKLGPAAFKITEADAVAAAQHHVRVLTTLGWPLRRLVRQRARSADPWPVHNGGVLSRWTLADSRRG